MIGTIVNYANFYRIQPLFWPRLCAYQGEMWQAIRRDGVYVFENFKTVEQVQTLKMEVDYLLDNNPRHVIQRSDERIYGAERISATLKEYSEQPFFEKLKKDYTTRTELGFVLAARMRHSNDNKGSGEGWHRDSFIYRLKGILYLSDVSLENGPFEYLLGSHKIGSVLRTCAQLKSSTTRYTDDQVEHLKAKGLQSKKFVAKAGTLIIADTSGIHRGAPMSQGERYALTHYYFPKKLINSSLEEKFSLP